MKENFEVLANDVSALKDAVAKLGTSLTAFETAVVESKAFVLTLDKDAEKLKAIKAEYVSKHNELVETEKKLESARAALAKLKDMHL